MPNPYREIFRAPGTKGFAAAGFVARLLIAMAPIGIVAMLSQARLIALDTLGLSWITETWPKPTLPSDKP